MRISRLLLILLSLLTMGGVTMAVQRDNLEKLRKEKQATTRQIKETARKLRDNKNETSRQLSRLDGLKNEMARQNAIIRDARQSADSVSAAMKSLTDSITAMEAELSKLQRGYAAALRKMQSNVTPATKWTFLLSSGSVGKFYRRMRYLKQFSAWRARKAGEINRQRDALSSRREQLQELSRQRDNHLQRASLAGRQLEQRRDQASRLVDSLRREGGSLRQFMQKQEAAKRRLDSQIDRLIAQEQERQRKAERERAARDKARRDKDRKARDAKEHASGSKPKPATSGKSGQTSATRIPDPDRELSGSFESNRGNLLFPVSGKYRISRGFGRQRHPDLPHVVTDNSGIDIAVSKGSKARAVFRGKVSAIFSQPGFNAIVMVRHGAYITIYAGLGSLAVKTGDTVSAGQALGTIVNDSNTGKPTLHFEIRHEREKLNPTHWIR